MAFRVGAGGIIRLPPLEQTPPRKVAPPPLLKRVFHFSRESLGKLKSKANSEAGTDNQISSFQALSALLWRAITRCQNPIGREVVFVLLVGARSRIGLPDGYFGNAVYTSSASACEREILQNGIGYAALKINELVTQQTSEAAIKDVENAENRTVMRKMTSFFIIGSTRHNVYGNDFGWGKPIAAITIFPAAESGGIDLEVCLATQKWLLLEDDPEFTAAQIQQLCKECKAVLSKQLALAITAESDKLSSSSPKWQIRHNFPVIEPRSFLI